MSWLIMSLSILSAVLVLAFLVAVGRRKLRPVRVSRQRPVHQTFSMF